MQYRRCKSLISQSCGDNVIHLDKLTGWSGSKRHQNGRKVDLRNVWLAGSSRGEKSFHFHFSKNCFWSGSAVSSVFPAFCNKPSQAVRNLPEKQNKQAFFQICQPMPKMNNAICCSTVSIFHRVIKGWFVSFLSGLRHPRLGGDMLPKTWWLARPKWLILCRPKSLLEFIPVQKLNEIFDFPIVSGE